MVKNMDSDASVRKKLDAAFHESQINMEKTDVLDNLGRKEIGSTGITDGILNNSIVDSKLNKTRKQDNR